ncbi:MAG: hypothetical protein IID32_11615 [Planctomycetes bacterium]|nr:hypothetical protein [Planctomycetota bacterium]
MFNRVKISNRHDQSPSLSAARAVGGLALFLFFASVYGCATTLSPINRPLVIDRDFEEVWSASRNELVRRGFVIDRLDKRIGVIETFPLVSRQWFEFWRQDVVTHDAAEEASLQTIRRRVLVKISLEPDGKIAVECDVQVERLASKPKETITQTRPRDIFSNISGHIPALGRGAGYGEAIEDWIYLGKDSELEVELLRVIGQELR